MRNLLIFMFLVGIFVLGRRSCNGHSFLNFGGISGSGPLQTETRDLRDFHGIDLQIAADVEVSVGTDYTVEISAQQNLVPLLKTSLENGVLRIHADDNFNSSEPVRIRVSAPAFDRFSVGGSGSIKVISPLQSEKMNLEISGSGDITIPQADFGTLNTSIGGSGTVELGGKADQMKSEVSGSGDVKAKNLSANSLEVSLAGSGSVTADVSTSLNVSITGSGDVYYSGTPSVQSNVTGSGSVQKMNAQ